MSDRSYKSIEWKDEPLLLLLIGGLLALPLVAPNPFIQHIFITTFLAAAVAVAWNILGGYLGLLSLAHGVFFGVGAYTTILAQKDFGINAWVAILLGIVIAVVVGAIIFHPTFRLSGHFFALGSLGFLVIALTLAVYFSDITGGSRGVFYYGSTGLKALSFNSKVPYYYIALTYLAMTTYIAHRLRWNRRGFYFVAIREDEEAAKALGINPTINKHIGLAISVALTTLGGGLYIQYVQYLDPDTAFSLTRSINFVIYSIAGGIGTVVGPVFGATLLQPIQIISSTFLGSQLGGIGYMLYGIFLILIIIYMPDGLNGVVLRVYNYINNWLVSNIPGEKDAESTEETP